MASLLQRFHDVQAGGTHERALAELRAGRKLSHWIWYVLPQIEGLGRSATARLYSLRGVSEAAEYLRDDVLRERLEEVVAAVHEHVVRRKALLRYVMAGQLDATKAVSCFTLFEAVAEKGSVLREQCTEILDAAEAQGFPRCDFTLAQAARVPRG